MYEGVTWYERMTILEDFYDGEQEFTRRVDEEYIGVHLAGVLDTHPHQNCNLNDVADDWKRVVHERRRLTINGKRRRLWIFSEQFLRDGTNFGTSDQEQS